MVLENKYIKLIILVTSKTINDKKINNNRNTSLYDN